VLGSITNGQWDTLYAIVGTVTMVIALVSLVVRPIASRAKRAADAASKLAFETANSAAKLVVEAASASNKVAVENAEAASKLNLDSAVRHAKLDASLNTMASLQEGTSKRVEGLITVQEGHDRRLVVLETAKGAPWDGSDRRQ
jgi:hypothetical protein